MKFYEVTEDVARKRNLFISIVKTCIVASELCDKLYTEQEVQNTFLFSRRDIAYYAKTFFDCCDGKYALNDITKKRLQKVSEVYRRAQPYLMDAEVIFMKAYDRFKEVYYSGKQMRYDHDYFRRTYESLLDTVEILHWGRLPILNKYLMINSRMIPESDVKEFYYHPDMLKAMYRDIRGEGEKMSIKSDDTLNKRMTIRIYTRRWGHEDVYSIERTIDGWMVDGTQTKKDGSNELFRKLNHDYVFYPEDGVKHALEELWDLANGHDLPFDAMNKRMQEVADWISAVERIVGEKQPDWVNYY